MGKISLGKVADEAMERARALPPIAKKMVAAKTVQGQSKGQLYKALVVDPASSKDKGAMADRAAQEKALKDEVGGR